MTSHDRVFELAAAAIDFDLAPSEREELDQHLATCASCRRSAALMRAQAAALASASRPTIAPDRSTKILRAALRRHRRGPDLRLLAVAAAIAVIGGGALAVGAQLLDQRTAPTDAAVIPSESPNRSESPSPTPSAAPSEGASTPPAPSLSVESPEPGLPTASPSAPPTGPSLPAGPFPVAVDARFVGSGVTMAPAGDGSLYVAIPDGDAGGTVLTRLGPDGEPSPGWPRLLDSPACRDPLPAADASVRIVCAGFAVDSPFPGPDRIFALDASGNLLPGWPVEVSCCTTGRISGNQLLLAATIQTTDVIEPAPAEIGLNRVVVVQTDGRVREGFAHPIDEDHVGSYIGPDGIGYEIQRAGPSAYEMTAFDEAAVLNGWPVRFDGVISPPSFAADGRVVLAVSDDDSGSRLVFLDRSGGEVGGSGILPVVPPPEWTGAGADLLGRPVVARDGTTFVVGTAASTETEIWAVDGSGAVMDGWPWTPPASLGVAGYCPPTDTGCGQMRHTPTVGLGNTLHVLYGAVADAQGGGIVALTPDGQVREGWPVTLNRSGSEFWSVVTDADGVSYVLAIEPESADAFSGTIVSLAPDSTVLYSTTIIEP